MILQDIGSIDISDLFRPDPNEVPTDGSWATLGLGEAESLWYNQ